MIVYLNQKNFDYPDQPENESHWVRNGLLTTGALVGAHFGAKAGLFGRHMQKFAGNNQAWLGNKLKMYDIARSGQAAAENAVAKINAGVTGRGGAEAFKAAGKSTADYRNAIKQARKSGDVTMVDKNLLQEERIRTKMDQVAAGNNKAAESLGKQGFNKEMDYDQFKEQLDKTGKYTGNINFKTPTPTNQPTSTANPDTVPVK